MAWWTGDIKYDAAAGWDNGQTRVELLGGRYLSATNKFRTQFDSYALGALLSRDNWDYVDRYRITARFIERLGGARGSRLQVEAGWTEDEPLVRVLDTDPWVGYLRPNRGIYSGSYFRTLATLDINPDISGQFVRQGWGFQVQYDGGVGDLNYSRIQGRAVARKDFSRAYLVTVIQAGTTLGDSIPPQQLFEVGGAVGLPGYEYKQYAGNKGVLGRVRLTIPIPLFTLGGALNKALSVPTSQPSISFGYQGAWTSISNAGFAGGRHGARLPLRYRHRTDRGRLRDGRTAAGLDGQQRLEEFGRRAHWILRRGAGHRCREALHQGSRDRRLPVDRRPVLVRRQGTFGSVAKIFAIVVLIWSSVGAFGPGVPARYRAMRCCPTSRPPGRPRMTRRWCSPPG